MFDALFHAKLRMFGVVFIIACGVPYLYQQNSLLVVALKHGNIMDTCSIEASFSHGFVILLLHPC